LAIDGNQSAVDLPPRNPSVDLAAVVADLETLALHRFHEVQVLHLHPSLTSSRWVEQLLGSSEEAARTEHEDESASPEEAFSEAAGASPRSSIASVRTISAAVV
jgi:hypothetical protein